MLRLLLLPQAGVFLTLRPLPLGLLLPVLLGLVLVGLLGEPLLPALLVQDHASVHSVLHALHVAALPAEELPLEHVDLAGLVLAAEEGLVVEEDVLGPAEEGPAAVAGEDPEVDE